MILITNDDGIHAEGLRALAEALAGLGRISIVAPNRERSAAAQSLTLRQPIVCEQRGENEWAVEGTPADAVIVALHKLLPEPPDLVVSGINRGANMGENVYYSGTVGAAREAVIHNIPAFAVSVAHRGKDFQYEHAAAFSRALAQIILKEGLPKDPRGRRYFWLHEQQMDKDIEENTDYAAIRDAAIAVTPLHLDHTHATSLNHLSHWAKLLESALKK